MSCRRLRLALAALVLELFIASGAWACVPQPIIFVQPRASGPPGSQVTVDGQNFESSRAEIRWNAFDGPLLAAATGPNFSASITIPPAPDGLYTLIALIREASGGIGGVTRAAFQVVGPDGVKAGAAPVTSRARASSGVSPALAAVGGGALVALGGLGGLALTRRRGGPLPPAGDEA